MAKYQPDIGGRKYSILSPDICPHCHIKCDPKLLTYYNSQNEYFESCHYNIWICPNKECKRHFIAEYTFQENYPAFNRFINGIIQSPEWPTVIQELLSGFELEAIPSKFIDTYLQALIAESKGLNEIAGMGFRKSIEYLVKDVAARDFPDNKEEIKKLFLGDVIKNFYTGEIKELLERATWLGNDQSHYFKLFEEYDVETLKELIGLIVSELDTAFRKKKYIENIQSRKGK